MSEHSKPVILPWRKWASWCQRSLDELCPWESRGRRWKQDLEYTPPHLALGCLVSSDDVTVLEFPLPSPNGLVPFKRIPQIIVETRE